MKKTLAVALVLMLLGISALCETEISVSGTGNVQISADYALISVGVSSRDKKVQEAQSKTNEAILKIRNALGELGIEEEDISTDRVNIYTSYSDRISSSVDYYNASQTLQIKLNNLTMIGSVIDTAFAAGANSLGGISYYANDSTEAQNAAIALAVENAKAKAEVLASALGLKITGVKSVEPSYSYASAVTYSNMSFSLRDDSEGSYTPTMIRPDKINVSNSVMITFIAEVDE